jgi:uncharacterized protein (DUF362 family)
MKSIVNYKGKDKVLPYPKLMKHSDGTIILINKNECGMVVHSMDRRYPIGTYNNDWSGFRDCNDEVTLSNE